MKIIIQIVVIQGIKIFLSIQKTSFNSENKDDDQENEEFFAKDNRNRDNENESDPDREP